VSNASTPVTHRVLPPVTCYSSRARRSSALALHCLLGAFLLLPGCARFHSQPLSPGENAERLESRSLTNADLKLFLEKNLHRELASWPAETWDFDMLTLAAFYYQPSLEVARAQWAVARGGETTAAQRPNPSLNVTPGYDTTTSIPSPWFPLATLDIPIETAGKRRLRRAQAAHLSEAARLNIATVAWQVRSNLRSSLLDFGAAGQRAALLEQQVSLQEQGIKLLDQQVQAGALADSAAAPFRIALVKTRLDLADAQQLRTQARARVAEAIGVPISALELAKLPSDPLKAPGSGAELASAEVQRAALQSRPDILGGLAEYAAAQSALQLEIAKQYPDVHVGPGYQYDLGDNKWSLGITLDLPILNQNQGPIAEATARRREAAARFNDLQARVLAEIGRAVQTLQIVEKSAVGFHALADEQAKRRDSTEAQFQAGAVERLDLLNAQTEFAAAELLQLEGQIKLKQALGALEDAVQRPLFGSAAAAPSSDSELLQNQPTAAK
jgi:cobalt-zinc-cadmium efflux system outer membrane protein